MKNLRNTMKSTKGITLIALVITIIILIILIGISINMLLGENGIIERTKTATQEYNEQAATESMNLKITTCQMNTYAEEQRMPTLKELAVELEKDNEIQYVNGAQRVASTQDINFTTATSIFTKLKAYPYEFEINSSLQLASIDGVQVASIPTNDDDTIVSMTKKELKKMIQDEIAANTPSSNTNASNNYSTDEQIIGTWTDGKPLYQKTISYTGTINAGAEATLDSTVSNIDNVVLIKGTSYRSGGNYTYYCNISEAHSSTQMVNVYYEKFQNIFHIHCVAQYNNTTYQITFQYTKTTDTIPE